MTEKCRMKAAACKAGLTIVPVVPWEGALAARRQGALRSTTAKFLPCCFEPQVSWLKRND